MSDPFVTPEQLEDALGPQTYSAIFDDLGDGTTNADAVTLILRAAHADVMRYASRGFDGPIPDPPPDEVWALELDFAKARSLMRGDAYTRDTGERLLRDARDTAEAIAGGLQRGSVKMGNPTSVVSPAMASPGSSAAVPVRFDSGGCPTEGDRRTGFWRRERC